MRLFGRRSLFISIIYSLFLISIAAAAAEVKKSKSVVNDILKVQVLLDRNNFSPGEIDGKLGVNTTAALKAYQNTKGLKISGKPDQPTLKALGAASAEVLQDYTITKEDVAGPFAENIPEDFMQKAELEGLHYTSPVELIAEKFHANPVLLQKLNPNANFQEGETISVPNVTPFSVPGPEESGEVRNQNDKVVPAGRRGEQDPTDVTVEIIESLSALVVKDPNGKMLYYAPITSGSERDPLPKGEWKINSVHKNPVFNYNPDLFWDADPSHAKAKIRPGPNNPVGVVWIDLSAKHYGIHGTPDPSTIGYAQSHGCIRLTNWDALKVAELVKPGTPVKIH